MPARCSSCGNTVLTYGQLWKLNFRPTASAWAGSVKLFSSPHVKCAHCGVEVAQRHYRARTFGYTAIFVLALIAVTLLTDSLKVWGAVYVGLLVVIAAEGFWAFRALPWDPVQPSAVAPPAAPPAG
jgi:DNA-directed RNA polymerase subunit N (RpoN/RPB10)